MADFDERSTRALARALSRWFEAEARDLAWRRTRDPYAIWVSEVMLQQTRVETVERYWPEFLARFPDLASLAAAREDEVLEQWSGLGYYRRARLLHRGAKQVHEQLGGQLPRSAAELRTIPGIGRYTAGAIASIAFDERAPLVDGNVARVRSRLLAIADPREQDAKHEGHWRFVAQILEHGSPRILAQALMELGATICTPRSPGCSGCPLRSKCRARREGSQASIPAVKLKKPSPKLRYFALGLRHRGRLLLERRADEGLLAGLWCLPLFARDPELALAEHARALSVAAGERFGVELRLAEAPAGEVEHVFSHRIWQLVVWPARARRAPKIDRREHAWISEGDAPEGGVPSLTRKLLRTLGEG
ncbi:MAG: A/G-specific adenine glycosylase [Enhygromyxa sp.]